jgi:hypothetical protein
MVVRGKPLQTPVELQQLLAAERTGRPFLVWRSGDGAQRILRLEPGRWRVTIGRDPEADVSLAHDHQVSRVHALLERAGQEWTLIDDGLSRNGSFVNGTRLVGRHRLADHDRLCFGRTEVRFRHSPTAPASDLTAPAEEGSGSIPLSPMQRRVLIALCRPVHESESATPATNRQVAAEASLSVNAVKAHLRVLFERFGLEDLPQNEKRARLAAAALVTGTLEPRDF